VPASVAGVSLALDQPFGLERVEQVDQHAVVDAHQLGQLALAEGPAVGQQVQDAELSGLESATATAAPAAAKRKSSRRPSPRPTVVSKSTTSARAASGTRQDDLDKLVTLCEVCHRRVRKKKMR
jgi:hypothetical protein